MRRRQFVTAIGTAAALATAYVLYAETLGLLTDYPQLDAALKTPLSRQDSKSITSPSARESEVAAVRGFGPGCREVSAPLILESRSKDERGVPAGRGIGLYVYADTYELPPENPKQLVLKPCSLIDIVRSKDDLADHDEINSLHGAKLVLEFDRPIDPTRLTGVNPVSGWVEGDVVLKTNRRTPDPSDDIVMFTDRLHYDRGRNLIWADNTVRIVMENERVSGSGLEVELHESADESVKKSKSAAKSARLLRDVRFELVVQDGKSFLGGRKAASSGANGPTTKTDVVITSRGPFVFDMETETARFERMVRVLQRNPPETPNGEPRIDQLEADLLTLRFARNEPGMKGGGDPGSARIQQATATGEHVVLLSDSQSLQATGNYLDYNADQRRITLRGEQEMIAVQNNAVIHARSLVIDHDESSEIRQLVADGPNGWMELQEQAKGKPPSANEKKARLMTRWQGRLLMTRKPDSQQQIVHITGSVELEHDRDAMTCNDLKVHLAPSTGLGAKQRGNLEPVKLEAEGNVSAQSERWAVNTETLLMDILRRQDAQGQDGRDAEMSAPPRNATRDANDGKLRAQPPKPEARPPSEKQDPLVIAALRVSIVVEQHESGSRPKSAWAEGNVRVTQTPSRANESPVEIRGEQMEYKSESGSEVLVVSGSPNTPASVKKSTEMYLEARHRIVYQEDNNRIEVGGAGLLKLQANNTLTGRSGGRRQPIQIDWSKAMNFDGKIAYFEGDVKARQMDAAAWCQIMQVTLDKRIDFRQSATGDKPGTVQPTIEFVHCDRDVQVLDREMDADRIARQLRIAAPESGDMRFDNVEGTVTVGGPGSVTIVEPNGGGGEGMPRSSAVKLPFVVTVIRFQDRMLGNRSTNVVKFYGGVHIVHTPVANSSDTIDEDKLPDGGMTIQAGRAEMSQSSNTAGRQNRLFSAYDNVKVQSRGYWATCGRLGYNQETDTLILAAEQDRSAMFYRQLRPGQPEESFSARQIRFDRRTGEIRTDGSDGVPSFDVGSPERSIRRQR